MKHSFPDYKLKSEFTPGTWGENDWALGETACVSRAYYALPSGNEYAIFKFCTRTPTGRKKLRWEAWYNGRFANNYFTCFDDAVQSIENEIRFHGFPGTLQSYRVYPELERK